ncbi:MAG: TetR/AcrR family transcriptional regulator [Pseudomonadota bacterium]
MRITQEAKRQNRQKILETAATLFNEQGYEKTTTRDISKACGMAKGTIFNYFPSKETLAMTMVAEAMEEGRQTYLKRRSGAENLLEDLFLFVASELRALRSFRLYIGPVLESGMSVFAKHSNCPAGEEARLAHLNTVGSILEDHDFEIPENSVTVTLYWSLYLGLLAHWSKDTSDNQQETLALLDYSMRVFTSIIAGHLPQLDDGI